MKRLSLLAAAACLPGLAACGDGGTATVRITASDTAALRQALSAVEVAEFDQICLNVVDVRLRLHADDEAENGWHSVPVVAEETDWTKESERPCPLDLAALLRGETVELAYGEVPAGDVKEIRFVLDHDQGWATLVDAPEGPEIPVFVPSGSQSGLKLKGASLRLDPDEEATIALAFDASASIREHNEGKIRIRPVIHVHGIDATPIDWEDGTGGNGPVLQ